jgi:hypothetical protein
MRPTRREPAAAATPALERSAWDKTGEGAGVGPRRVIPTKFHDGAEHRPRQWGNTHNLVEDAQGNIYASHRARDQRAAIRSWCSIATANSCGPSGRISRRGARDVAAQGRHRVRTR